MSTAISGESILERNERSIFDEGQEGVFLKELALEAFISTL